MNVMVIKMSYSFDIPSDPDRLYPCLCTAMEGLLDGEKDITANLASASSLIKLAVPDILWAGFYIFKEGELVLGPFQGKPACIRIKPGRGVCGAAFSADKTIVADDVKAFPGHIACDSESKSEIVIPLRVNGGVFGVLDMDSGLYSRFSQADKQGLEQLAAVIESHLSICD